MNLVINRDYFVISFLTFVVSVNVSSCCYNIRLELVNHQKPDTHLLLASLTGVENVVNCATSCSRRLLCQSFFHNAESLHCLHYRGGMEDLILSTVHGWTGSDVSVESRCSSIVGYTYSVAAGVCSKVHQVKKTWVEARETCLLEGADMITIDTPARTQLVQTVVQQDGLNEYFLGATDTLRDGEWRWLKTNEILSQFTKTGSSQCLEIEEDLNLDDTGCSNQNQKFICQQFIW